MARTPQDVTDAELAVLQVLWELETATVREITDRLYLEGTTATVQKLLERLELRGFWTSQNGSWQRVFRVWQRLCGCGKHV